jgi:phosphoesterase RecJ-like protein
LKELAQKIKSSKHIVLSTHRQCDGDGLGAQMALYFALRKIGKDVRIINVDATPKKYHFLKPNSHIQYFEHQKELPAKIDLFIIFDTNDERLVEPLFSAIQKLSPATSFVDHHPVLKKGPQPTALSWIDITAASTGEMTYNLIKELQIPLDHDIAHSIYTSITFDTQLYRFIRNSPVSHLIAAELLTFNIHPEEVHRSLFGNQTVQKMAFLARALGQIEYHCEGTLAVLKIKDADLFHYNLEPDDSRDVVDMVMNIETLEAAILFREDAVNEFKLSLRSKGRVEVLDVAEMMGGGGHLFSAGAFIKGEYDELKDKIVHEMSQKLSLVSRTGS